MGKACLPKQEEMSMEKEKRRENKQSRKSENFGKKWKLLASVWVLMLAFLLVPGMKSEAAA